MQRTGSALVFSLALISVCPARSAEPAAALEGVTDRGLRSDISRAIGEVKTPAATRVEARRRAREAAENATALLRSEGYYESQVEALVSESDPPKASVKVTPGPRFVLAAPQIQWVGRPPGTGAAGRARKALGLTAGAPGRAADIIAAETRAVLVLGTLGYADAIARPRQVIVDHADHTVRPTFRLEAGSLVRLGAVEVRNPNGRTKPSFVRSLAPWKPGDIYDPERLARLERRLTETGVFESASAQLAPQSEATGEERPVIVALVERPRRTIEVGAAYSTTAGAGFNAAASMGGSSFGAYSTIEGSGVDARWTHYNLLGVADTSTLTARLYDIQQVLDAELDLPDWRRPDQTLKAGADVLNERTPAYDDTGAGVRVAIERHWTKTNYVSVGGYFDYVSLSQKEAVNPESTPVGKRLRLVIPTAFAAFSLDHSNDILDPTRGWRLYLRAEPTLVTGDRSITYVKTQAQVSGYWPILGSERTVLAGRLEVGSILGGALPAVPADRRFYSGGGGSVRGFAYQAVGPRLSDNTPEGGLSLAEASFEVRHRLNAQWGLAAFVDAGQVGTSPAPTLRGARIGAGVGVRYDLGFGPLRLDIGTPINPRKGDAPVQVYISIGQSF
ncbi:MAG TPA: autotransporter assembly complex family protein [Caulobacteraceae bacterium]|nr:autotransporter assembly complex family protein [Caulobacteraceae bacterium]